METINTMNFSLEQFNSASEFVEAISKRPLGKFNRGEGSLRTGMAHALHCWTKDYNEAQELLVNGYADCLKEMHEQCGSPIVPNAISGKYITIWYNVGVSAYVSTASIRDAGVRLLELIRDLEKQGYRVKLNVLNGFESNYRKSLAFSIMLKDFHQPLNIMNLSYFVAHPSFPRRHGFRWMETSPEVESGFYFPNYGKSFCLNDVNCMLKECKLLNNGDLVADVLTLDHYGTSEETLNKIYEEMGKFID